MKKSLGICCIIFGMVFFVQNSSYAQNGTMDDVHLFQSFFRDAPITTTPYGEGYFNYSNYDVFNGLTIGPQGGFAVTPDIEVGAGIYYVNIDPDDFDSESGITDIPIFGRYNFLSEETKLSGGALITLPVGSEDIGAGNFNFGFFGAVRHPVSDYVVITGTLGIDFLESVVDDYEASLNLGGGVIYAATEEVSVLGEISIQSETDNSALSGGVDYKIENTGRLRGNLLLGLDDGAADFGLTAGFLFTF